MYKQHCKMIIYGFALLFLLATFSGCALTKDYITPQYQAQESAAKIAGAEKVQLTVTITDVRSIKDKVSCKKDVYGMELAPIIAKCDVAVLVSNAISEELSNRGFKVKGGGVTVGVELTKFYNDFKRSMWSGSTAAEVAFTVQVKKADGNISFVKSIDGFYTEEGIQRCSGENAQKALEGALKDAVAKLIQDEAFIKALLQKGS